MLCNLFGSNLVPKQIQDFRLRSNKMNTLFLATMGKCGIFT